MPDGSVRAQAPALNPGTRLSWAEDVAPTGGGGLGADGGAGRDSEARPAFPDKACPCDHLPPTPPCRWDP